MRCDGRQLLAYREDLVGVLRATLHLRCKEASELAGCVLRYLLKALTLTYALDYRSTDTDWDDPDCDVLPIRVGCIYIHVSVDLNMSMLYTNL